MPIERLSESKTHSISEKRVFPNCKIHEMLWKVPTIVHVSVLTGIFIVKPTSEDGDKSQGNIDTLCSLCSTSPNLKPYKVIFYFAGFHRQMLY